MNSLAGYKSQLFPLCPQSGWQLSTARMNPERVFPKVKIVTFKTIVMSSGELFMGPYYDPRMLRALCRLKEIPAGPRHFWVSQCWPYGGMSVGLRVAGFESR